MLSKCDKLSDSILIHRPRNSKESTLRMYIGLLSVSYCQSVNVTQSTIVVHIMSIKMHIKRVDWEYVYGGLLDRSQEQVENKHIKYNLEQILRLIGNKS
jgi:hypothetical protein